MSQSSRLTEEAVSSHCSAALICSEISWESGVGGGRQEGQGGGGVGVSTLWCLLADHSMLSAVSVMLLLLYLSPWSVGFI